ncbi:helix-turn-helix domain-containing protein [Paenibacillus hubeiensis]|uniref:helix-turn-helix domain-containing protein n=1 Tax=Paenibacillus hubeiensis TaxID=3077330 RepID=UPI0031BBBEF8
MHNFQQENIEFICNLAHNIYKIPIYYFDSENTLTYEAALDFRHNPLYTSNPAIITELFTEMGSQHFPVIRETLYHEKFFAINVHFNQECKGRIVVGPVINFRMTEETIKITLRDLVTRGNKEEIKHYYDQVPVISNFNFINLSMIIYFMLYQQKLELADILLNNEGLDQNMLEIEQPYSQIIDGRQNNLVHTEIDKEKKLLDFIRLGRTDKVLENFHAIHKQGKKGVLSKTSFLRSQKNLAISLITLTTRAAVEGGLYQEIAYNLSDLYILKLEELTESRAVDELIEDVLIDFAERVANSKKHKYSRPINICQNFIFNHLNKNITVSQLAELTSLNPNYLSNLFKKEVGISIPQFIQKTKIEEAKNLLSYSSYSLAEISTMLNFYDQSYFAKVFKKFTGCTPKQFINQN